MFREQQAFDTPLSELSHCLDSCLEEEILTLKSAGAGAGGNIGKEGERGEEQEEYTRRMRRNVEKRGLVDNVLRMQHGCCKKNILQPML